MSTSSLSSEAREVPFLHRASDTHRHSLTILGLSAGAHGHHQSLISLGLSFLGDQETTLGFRLCCGPLNRELNNVGSFARLLLTLT